METSLLLESITSSILEEAVGKCVSNGLANWVSKETEDLRKVRNDAKIKHPLLNRAAPRKRLKDLRTILIVFYLANQAKYLDVQL